MRKTSKIICRRMNRKRRLRSRTIPPLALSCMPQESFISRKMKTPTSSPSSNTASGRVLAFWWRATPPRSLPRIEKFVKEYDIRIAIHNHGPEDKLWHSPQDVLQAVKGMDPRIGCCIDVGHAVRAGTDVVQAIHEVGPRLFNLHMKDLTNFDSKESQVAVGDGIMPVRQIFQALIATKYNGFLDLEYEIHPDDPMPGVIASFAYMRGVLAGMGSPSQGHADQK